MVAQRLSIVVPALNEEGAIARVVLVTSAGGGDADVINASIGVGSLRAGGVIPGAEVWLAFRAWWMGDALGYLVVGPLLLTWHGVFTAIGIGAAVIHSPTSG